jgi:hypothetical protein
MLEKRVPDLLDIERWRGRAEEARSTAEVFADPSVRRIMLNISASYDHMIQIAEQRLALRAVERRQRNDAHR